MNQVLSESIVDTLFALIHHALIDTVFNALTTVERRLEVSKRSKQTYIDSFFHCESQKWARYMKCTYNLQQQQIVWELFMILFLILYMLY